MTTLSVCVLGMMRSGTSAVAGILQLLGVRLGEPERLLAANRANPTGFGEHREIIAINDELLARRGGTWFAPPGLPPGWERDPGLDDLRARANSLIHSELATAERWGWKDPRTCLTLPFWQALVPGLTYVVCVRSPVDSARSLASLPWAQRRIDEPYARGLDLWLRFTESALEHTDGLPRLIVSYDDLVIDGAREVARIAAFAGVEEGRASQEAQRAVAGFLQPSLRHQRAAAQDTDDGPEHPAHTLYASLRTEIGGLS